MAVAARWAQEVEVEVGMRARAAMGEVETAQAGQVLAVAEDPAQAAPEAVALAVVARVQAAWAKVVVVVTAPATVAAMDLSPEPRRWKPRAVSCCATAAVHDAF